MGLKGAFFEESFDDYNKHLALMAPYSSYVPKHHVCVHMMANLELHGNPSTYSNWTDESLNKILKASCRHVSQRTFESSLLLRMRELLAVSGPIKRSRVEV